MIIKKLDMKEKGFEDNKSQVQIHFFADDGLMYRGTKRFLVDVACVFGLEMSEVKNNSIIVYLCMGRLEKRDEIKEEGEGYKVYKTGGKW